MPEISATGKGDGALGPNPHADSFDPRSFPIEHRWFERPESIHGLSHTRRVLIHACEIAASLDLTDPEFESLMLAVAWHDIGRTHDGREPDHGAKSVARIEELGLATDVHPQILACLLFAVELHSVPDETALRQAGAMDDAESLLRVLWVLKDADGLDRVRIADLDPGQLRHPVSRDRVAEAWDLLKAMP